MLNHVKSYSSFRNVYYYVYYEENKYFMLNGWVQ